MSSLKKSSLLILSLILGFSFGSPSIGRAAESPATPPKGAEALMAYPKEVRQAALEVSLHPNLLLEVKAIQTDATSQLKALLMNLPEATQKQVYRVIRSPKLVLELTAGGPKSAKQIKNLVRDYPKEIREAAPQVVPGHFELFKQVQSINETANKKFEALIQHYPAETRKSFLILLQHPVALEILAKNPNYSYLIGKNYAAKGGVAQDRLKAVEPTAHKKDVAAGKRSQQELNLDPQAEKLDAAAQDFVAKADQPLSEVLDPSKAAQMNVSFVPYPYPVGDALPSFGADPYWYGYPDWGPADWWWY